MMMSLILKKPKVLNLELEQMKDPICSLVLIRRITLLNTMQTSMSTVSGKSKMLIDSVVLII